MRSFHRFLALAFPALLAYAQDISGDWQATMLSIDQSPDRAPVRL